jgi:hypothetical protein
MRRRLQSFAIRVTIATLVAWVIATMPLPVIAPERLVAFIQVPIVVFFLICYIGKLLIDTFFYDRYQP